MPQLAIDKDGSLIPIDRGRATTDFETAVYIPDAHLPHIREPIFERLLQFLKDFQPHKIFILGDWLDFYNLSSFDQDPDLHGQLQKELNLGHYYIEQIRKVCPKSEGVFLEGNHEDRLRRWLWRHPDIASLMDLNISSLLGLKELDFDSIEYGDYYDYNGFLVKHGDLVRVHSGYTAKGELDKMGSSGISGHTHRLGSHYKTDNLGTRVWFEGGCICEMELPWAKNNNWQHGFSVSYHEQNGNRFFVEQVPIIKDRFVAPNGSFYK